MLVHISSELYVVLKQLFKKKYTMSNNIPYYLDNFNNPEDMVVTVSPANADRTEYQTNKMRSYLRRSHIEVVNVLCVPLSFKKRFAHCSTRALHFVLRFLLCRATVSCSWACWLTHLLQHNSNIRSRRVQRLNLTAAVTVSIGCACLHRKVGYK